MQDIEPLKVLEAVISKVTPDKLIIDLGAEFTGIISRNDISLKADDKSTAGFKVGDIVRAAVISEKDGIVKMSIRKLQQQQRDEEAAYAEKAEAEAIAALRLNEEKQRQEEKKRRDMEAADARMAVWLKKENHRRWKEKTAYLKRYGAVVAALVITAVFAVVILTGNGIKVDIPKRADVREAVADLKSNDPRFVEPSKIEDYYGNNADFITSAKSNGMNIAEFYGSREELIAHIKAYGLKVVEADRDDAARLAKILPPDTIVVYR
jgi:predicted RNA-binding protein with RPS1 domain